MLFRSNKDDIEYQILLAINLNDRSTTEEIEIQTHSAWDKAQVKGVKIVNADDMVKPDFTEVDCINVRKNEEMEVIKAQLDKDYLNKWYLVRKGENIGLIPRDSVELKKDQTEPEEEIKTINNLIFKHPISKKVETPTQTKQKKFVFKDTSVLSTLNYIRNLVNPINDFRNDNTSLPVSVLRKEDPSYNIFDVINYENYKNLYCFTHIAEPGNLLNSIPKILENTEDINNMLKIHPLNNNFYLNVQATPNNNNQSNEDSLYSSDELNCDPGNSDLRCSKKYRKLDLLSSMNLNQHIKTSNIDILSLHPLKNNYMLVENKYKIENDMINDPNYIFKTIIGTDLRQSNNTNQLLNIKTIDSWFYSKNSLDIQRTNERNQEYCIIPRYVLPKDNTSKLYEKDYNDKTIVNYINRYRYQPADTTTKTNIVGDMFGGKKKRRKKTRNNRKKSLRHNKPKLTIIKRKFKSKRHKKKKNKKTRKRRK